MGVGVFRVGSELYESGGRVVMAAMFGSGCEYVTYYIMLIVIYVSYPLPAGLVMSLYPHMFIGILQPQQPSDTPACRPQDASSHPEQHDD